MLPEIVLLTETVDAVCRNADLLVPYLEGILIIQVNGRIEAVCRNAHTLCQELPGKVDGLTLEIVTEGKVAKHLEKGAVTSGLSDVFDVAGSNTLLAGGYTPSGRNLLSRKVRLQRSHTGIDQKQAVVIVRNQRKALHLQMSLFLKEIQEHSSQLIDTIFLHLKNLPCHSIGICALTFEI